MKETVGKLERLHKGMTDIWKYTSVLPVVAELLEAAEEALNEFNAQKTIINRQGEEIEGLERKLSTLEAELRQSRIFKMYEVQTKRHNTLAGNISTFYIKTDSQEAADKLADEVAKKSNSFVLSVTETPSKEKES